MKSLTCCHNEASNSESSLYARLNICIIDANSHDWPDNAAQEADKHRHPDYKARGCAAPDTDKVQAVQLISPLICNDSSCDQVSDDGITVQVIVMIQ